MTQLINTLTPKAEAFERAKAAAQAGDPDAMVVALFETPLFDGMVARLKRTFPGMPDHEIRDVVAKAVVKTYEYVRRGRSIASLTSFLFKVFRHEIYGVQRAHYAGRADVDVEGLPEDPFHVEDEDLRAKALAIAKGLLPLLGRGQIQLVMSYIFEVLEGGLGDISDTEIADALDLPVANVTTLRHRGFDRLARIAADRGLHMKSLVESITVDAEGEEDAD